MMKFIGWCAVAGSVLYSVYSMSPNEPCERLERGSKVAKWTVDAVATVMDPWVDSETKMDFKSTALDAQLWMTTILRTQFYNDDPRIHCAWDKYLEQK